MTQITINIPKIETDFKQQLIEGIEATVKAQVARVFLLERLNKALSGSKLTDSDCLRLGRKINKSIGHKLRSRKFL